MHEFQTALKLGDIDPKKIKFDFMIELLKGQDWRTAADLLKAIGCNDSESARRSLRNVAQASEGQIAGGQLGYKLVSEMTQEEYNHWRNWMKSQADEMTARVLASDKVFYRRRPVETANGIL